MGNKISHIPDDMSIHVASEFWVTHSVADYPSNIVQFEYKPEEITTFVAVSNDFLGQLEQKAKKSGISIETLVNLLIQEKLASHF